MIVAVLLIGYASLVSTRGARMLRGAEWAEPAPRLAVAGWLAVITSITSAVVFAGLALAVPMVAVSGSPADVLRACVMALRAGYATPGGAIVAATGTVTAAAVAGRAVWCTGAALIRAAVERRRHARALGLVGRHDAALGAVVLDHDTPVAYCLPGRHRRVVLTTAVLAALTPGQVDAVLAHERAHLRGRHGLLLAIADGAGAAFPGVPAFAAARAEIARLVELLADDAATRRGGHLDLAEAVLTLATVQPADGISAAPLLVPSGVLAATGSVAAGRVRRLLTPCRPLGRIVQAGGGVGMLALGVLPAAVLVTPALVATQMTSCTSTTWMSGTAGVAAWLAHPLTACG